MSLNSKHVFSVVVLKSGFCADPRPAWTLNQYTKTSIQKTPTLHTTSISTGNDSGSSVEGVGVVVVGMGVLVVGMGVLVVGMGVVVVGMGVVVVGMGVVVVVTVLSALVAATTAVGAPTVGVEMAATVIPWSESTDLSVSTHDDCGNATASSIGICT